MGDIWSNDPDRTTRREGSEYGQDDRAQARDLAAESALIRLLNVYGE